MRIFILLFTKHKKTSFFLFADNFTHTIFYVLLFFSFWHWGSTTVRLNNRVRVTQISRYTCLLLSFFLNKSNMIYESIVCQTVKNKLLRNYFSKIQRPWCKMSQIDILFGNMGVQTILILSICPRVLNISVSSLNLYILSYLINIKTLQKKIKTSQNLGMIFKVVYIQQEKEITTKNI